MLLLNRFLPFIASILIFGIFESFFFFSFNHFLAAGSMLTVLWLTLWQFHGRKIFEKNLWSFFISPAFFLAGGFFLALFFENAYFIHGIALLSAFLLFLFLNDVFLFLHHSFRYQAYSLENISNTLNLISVWFWSVSLFGAILLLQFSVWTAATVFFCFASLVEYQTFWIHKFDWRKERLRIILTAFLVTEFFVALSFFPTGFYTNGSVLAAIFYIFSGMERRSLLKRLDSRSLLRYLGIGLGVVFLILFTARWE